MAQAIDRPHSMIVAYQGLGFLYLRQGDVHQAIPLLERGLELCRAANISVWLPLVTAVLSAAYALSGRIAEALPLLQQALEQTAAMRAPAYHQWRVVYWLSDAYPFAARSDEMLECLRRAVQLSRTYRERGTEAWALRLLGEIHTHQEPLDATPAEDCYREALALASKLGMQPLLAHCHHGLGVLYHRTGRREEARFALSVAIKMYSEMKMVFWLIRAQVELANAD